MARRFGSVTAGTLMGIVLTLTSTRNLALAQTVSRNPPVVTQTDGSSGPSDPPIPASATTTSQPSAADQPGAIESSLFSSLFMSGKTQEQFKPLTPEERLKFYAKDLFSPFHLFMAGTSAALSQARNVPPAWGQGAEGYGKRFANYYATAAVADALQMTGEDLLHEDNLYYGSGYHGIWKRVKYAVKSSVLARSADGTQHLSISQIGSTAGAAFISRTWQPRSNDTAGDGAVSFGIQMATNAGVNVIREFLPDMTRHIFHRSPAPDRAEVNAP